MSIFNSLRDRLSKTRNNLVNRIKETISGKASLDSNTLEQIEEILISSDVGYYLSNKIIENVRTKMLNTKDRTSDKIIFDVKNGGKSFHSFAVTDATEGTGPAISGTEIGSASNPLKPGTGGQVTFVPSKAGTYYYICAVPGHREQGMEGKIIVEEPKPAGQAAAPTGTKVSFNLNFIESSDFRTLAFNALPGEEGNNPEIKVKSGDSVTIKVKNAGKTFHSFGVVTNSEDSTTLVWNSAIKDPNNPLKPNEEGEVTFTAGAPGTYYYICTVPGHVLQGMKGSFIVE